MLILKHVEFEIVDNAQLGSLLGHLKETTSQIQGIRFNDIYFMKDKKEFVLFLECDNEEKYLEWRKICPPPTGGKDWYEILLTKKEHFSSKK